MKRLNLVMGALLLGATTLMGANFNVDKSHTNLGFKVKHMLVSNTNGTFHTFNGTFSYDPKTKSLSALHGEVDVKSVDTKDEKRDKHLRSADFFDVKQYPNMQMEFVRQEGENVYVKLSIKGIAKEVKLVMEDASAMVKDPWGFERVGFVLRGKISRNDYNIKFNKMLDTGGFVVGDEIRLLLELEGTLAKK